LTQTASSNAVIPGLTRNREVRHTGERRYPVMRPAGRPRNEYLWIPGSALPAVACAGMTGLCKTPASNTVIPGLTQTASSNAVIPGLTRNRAVRHTGERRYPVMRPAGRPRNEHLWIPGSALPAVACAGMTGLYQTPASNTVIPGLTRNREVRHTGEHTASRLLPAITISSTAPNKLPTASAARSSRPAERPGK